MVQGKTLTTCTVDGVSGYQTCGGGNPERLRGEVKPSLRLLSQCKGEEYMYTERIT